MEPKKPVDWTGLLGLLLICVTLIVITALVFA